MARESYGEDIADTETEKSNGNGEEDDYEDSFIDDGDLKVFPSSPDSSDGGIFDALYVFEFYNYILVG